MRDKLIAYSYFNGGEYDKILNAINEDKEYKKVNIKNCFTIYDDVYPREFMELKYPPLVVYYEGNLDLLKERKIGVVGTRKPGEYAKNATRSFVRANDEYVIVSGLAKGIDTIAHENAARTIGILGCGIDYIYPYSNKELIERIKKEGLVLSEYPLMSKPLAKHFPFRNRLIAALGEKLYVMESHMKSGTMSTVNEALELGKQVAVLPFNIFDERGINNNHLIYEGAEIIEKNQIANL